MIMSCIGLESSFLAINLNIVLSFSIFNSLVFVLRYKDML